MRKPLICPVRGCMVHVLNWDGLISHLDAIHGIVARFWLKVGGIVVQMELPTGGLYKLPNGPLHKPSPGSKG